MTTDFTFPDPGKLVDGDFRLVLAEQGCKSARHHGVPFYRFDMKHVGDEALMGRITLRIGEAETVLRYTGHIRFGVQPEYRGTGTRQEAFDCFCPSLAGMACSQCGSGALTTILPPKGLVNSQARPIPKPYRYMAIPTCTSRAFDSCVTTT